MLGGCVRTKNQELRTTFYVLRMEKIVLLGTAGAVADGKRDNVSLVFISDLYHVLIECGGSAAHKLARLGLPYERLEDIIITHTHVDHVYGLPGLIFSMRYRDLLSHKELQRTTPLRIHCPEGAVANIHAILDVFGLQDNTFFPIEIRGIPDQENALVFQNDLVTITSTPVEHVPDLPTYGIKIVSASSGKTVVYSSDTRPSKRLIRFASQADLLFHECAGLSQHPIPNIHSNALQVGEVGKRSAVKTLVLLHFTTVFADTPEELVAEVRQNFAGEVQLASDFDEYTLEG